MFASRSRKTRRGNVLVITAASFSVLCGFSALVIDLGYVGVVESQLRTATDAASLAGARHINGSAEGLDAARAAAVAIAAMNNANGGAVVIDSNPSNAADGDVVLGEWDGSAFTPSLDPDDVNAIQVRALDADLVPFFSRVAFGTTDLAAAVDSIAVAGAQVGAGEVAWYLPFALPDCLWDTFGTDTLQDMNFVLSPPGADNTGWAMLGDASSAAAVAAHLNAISPCMKEWDATGTVSGNCTEAGVDEGVSLNNGVQSSGLKHLAQNAGTDGVPWDSEMWGEQPDQQANSAIPPGDYGMTYVGPIPVFDSGAEYCTSSGGSWNTTEPIVFFVWGVIYDVVTKGGAADKTVYLRLDLEATFDVGDWGGGSDVGVLAQLPSVLVK